MDQKIADGIVMPTFFWERGDCDMSSLDRLIVAFASRLRDECRAAENSCAQGQMAPETVTDFRRMSAIALNVCKWLVADEEPEDKIRDEIKTLASGL